MFLSLIESYMYPKVNFDLTDAIEQRNAAAVKQFIEVEQHLLANRTETELSKIDGRFHPKARRRLKKTALHLAASLEPHVLLLNEFRQNYANASVLNDFNMLIMLLEHKPNLVDENFTTTFPLVYCAVKEITLGILRPSSISLNAQMANLKAYLPSFHNSKSESPEDLAEKGYDPSNYRARVINV